VSNVALFNNMPDFATAEIHVYQQELRPLP
jgi:hypothetical protein